MAPKKQGYAAIQAASAVRFVKRSITVRPDVDAALREIAGGREYSQVANEASVLYVQARGIDAVLAEAEAAVGPITAEHRAKRTGVSPRRGRRAEQRRKARA